MDLQLHKELSLLCCVIRENEIVHGTLWQTFDLIFDIAQAFVDKYGVDDVEWGVDKEYEETVVEFAENYLKEQLKGLEG